LTSNPSVGEPVRVCPEGSVNREVILQQFQESLLTAVASEDGFLALTFAGVQSLAIQPDSDCEAWMLAGSNGFRVIATPTGGSAMWRSGGSRDDWRTMGSEANK
jgi:hypothetical protein